MKLPKQLLDRYATERQSAGEAQRTANEIAFAPVVFQVSRLMKKFGILSVLHEAEGGLSINEIAQKTSLSEYALKLLLESSLSIGTVLLSGEKFRLSKAGYFLLTDELVGVDMDFIHDVCYEGLFRLEETLKSGKPEGLKVFGLLCRGADRKYPLACGGVDERAGAALYFGAVLGQAALRNRRV